MNEEDFCADCGKPADGYMVQQDGSHKPICELCAVGLEEYEAVREEIQ